MFIAELILVLAVIIIGVRKGGPFLAMAGGMGMLIMTFVFRVAPSDPPITVILIMLAVICAAAAMQACGGLEFMVKVAEKSKDGYHSCTCCILYFYIYVWYRTYCLQLASGNKRNSN